MVKLRDFSWKRAHMHSRAEAQFSSLLGLYGPDLPDQHPQSNDPKPLMGAYYYPPSSHRTMAEPGNINPVSIAFSFRHRLRPG